MPSKKSHKDFWHFVHQIIRITKHHQNSHNTLKAYNEHTANSIKHSFNCLNKKKVIMESL